MSYNKENEKHTKAEVGITSHQQKDKNVAGSGTGDYVMHGADADKEKTKNEKTSITFEKKKEKIDDKDKNLYGKDKEFRQDNKDLHLNKEKDFSANKDFNANKDLNKDFNANKDLNRDFNKDLNKDKDFNKDLHKDQDWNKDLHKDKNWQEKDTHKDWQAKDVHQDKNWQAKDVHQDKEMHDKSEGKGIIDTIKEKVKDVLGSGDNDKSKDKDVQKDFQKDVHVKEKDVHMSSGADYNKNKDVNVSDKYATSNLGAGGIGQQQHLRSSDISSGQHASNLGASSEKQQFSGSAAGAGYSGATVDHKNLGAEHREVGLDKQANVIPSKETEKDSAHKVDIHGSIYTSGAGSTYKTNEAK